MGDLPGSPSVAPSPLFFVRRFATWGYLYIDFIMESRERRDRWSIEGAGGAYRGKQRLALRLLRGKFENRFFSLVGSHGRDHSARRRRIAAVGDESRTVRITAANMTRGE